jgi:hypothetical protein
VSADLALGIVLGAAGAFMIMLVTNLYTEKT